MPFGFLKRKQPEQPKTGQQGTTPASGKGVERSGGVRADAGRVDTSTLHVGSARGVPFTALTEDWRLRGRMEIAGRLTDALNKREALAITDVSWGPSDGSAPLEPAPGLRSVDPYDLILVTAGVDWMRVV